MHIQALQTLADPSRFHIVEELRGGERAVNDLVLALDAHQSGVSRHLRILQEAGFVRVRPDGARRLYSLCPEPFQEIDSWLSGYRSLWESRLDRLGLELLRRQKTASKKKKAKKS